MGVPGTINPETGNVYGGTPPSDKKKGSSNVVDSGRRTSTGAIIYEAKKSETDIRREASEQRVQKFTTGGKKISDTGRVEVTVGGEKKWVTPEHALATAQPGTIKYREAEKKLEAREELISTLKEKYSQQLQKKTAEQKTPLGQPPLRTNATELTATKKPISKSRDFVSMVNAPYGESSRIKEEPISQEVSNDERLDLNKKDMGLYTGSTMSAASDDLVKSTKRQRNPLFQFVESFKSGFQLKSSSRDDFTSEQQLDVAFTGRNPITGEKEDKLKSRSRQFASTLGTVSSIILAGETPKVLKGIDYLGNLVRGTKVAKKVYDINKFGRLLTSVATYGGEAYLTYKGGEVIVNALAPYETKREDLTGVSDKELKTIFGKAKSSEMGAGFKVEGRLHIPFTDIEVPGTGHLPDELPVVGGWGLKRFLVGSTGALLPAASPSKDTFSETVTQEAKDLGLNPMQVELVEKRLEQKRRGMGVVQTINLLQAEAFANVAGGKEVEIAKQAGRFTTWGNYFGAKVVPGAVEGTIATGSLLAITKPDLPMFIPRIEDVSLGQEYNSLTDPSFTTKRINITESDFSKLNITEGQPIPTGILSDKTNIIYNVIGKPTTTNMSMLTAEGIKTDIITTTPTTEVTLSVTRAAEQPVNDLFKGLWISKTGEQKQRRFIPSKSLLIAGGGAFGVVSAGLFGGLEHTFQGRIGSKVVGGIGYGSDIPEAPGDFLTPILTSGGDGTSVFTTSKISAATFTQDPTKVDINVQLDSKDISNTNTVSRIQKITATRTLEFDKISSNVFDNVMKDSKTNRRGSSKSLMESFTGISTPVKTTTDVMSRANTNTMADVFSNVNVNILTNARTDIISRTKTDVDVFSKVGTDTMSRANTNTMADVFSNVNVNVMTPKIPFLWVPNLDFFGGESGFSRKKKKKKVFRYTPDFQASVLNQFGPAPRKGQIWTGQERRLKIRGKRTNPIGNINFNFSNILGTRKPIKKRRYKRKR